MNDVCTFNELKMSTSEQSSTGSTSTPEPVRVHGSGSAVEILTKEHRCVKKLLTKYQTLVALNSPPELRLQLAHQVCDALTVHIALEEEIFYPKVREASDTQHALDTLEVKHSTVLSLIKNIEASNTNDRLFNAKMEVLREYVTDLVKEEEGQVFPKAKKSNLDMKTLGLQIQTRKDELIDPEVQNFFIEMGSSAPLTNERCDATEHTRLSNRDPRQNTILAALPEADYQRLLPHLTLVPMPLGWIMSKSGDDMLYVHFPTDGIVSLITRLDDGFSSEMALVGNEGMVGISIFMGGDTMTSSASVQNAGYAYRLDRASMKREFELGGKLQKLSLLYIQALIAQTSQTAICNQHHTVEQQLIRWLLMSTDCLQDNDITVTHDLLSTLLGTRRETVTLAVGDLQKKGLLTIRRGHIKVIDRPKLEDQSCECYAAVKNAYAHLLPNSFRRGSVKTRIRM